MRPLKIAEACYGYSESTNLVPCAFEQLGSNPTTRHFATTATIRCSDLLLLGDRWLRRSGWLTRGSNLLASKMIPVLASEALTLFLLVLLRILGPVVATPANPSLRAVIALVPAAWHSPIHYREYTNQLRFLGYQIITQRLPSCDTANPEAQSVGLDAAFIRRNLLLPPINDGRDVVLIMHSHSGGPGAVAAKGLSKAERHAAGQPGGIIGLIFISAFVAKEGQTLVSGSGGQLSPWVS